MRWHQILFKLRLLLNVIIFHILKDAWVPQPYFWVIIKLCCTCSCALTHAHTHLCVCERTHTHTHTHMDEHHTITCLNDTVIDEHHTITCLNDTVVDEHHTITCLNDTVIDEHQHHYTFKWHSHAEYPFPSPTRPVTWTRMHWVIRRKTTKPPNLRSKQYVIWPFPNA